MSDAEAGGWVGSPLTCAGGVAERGRGGMVAVVDGGVAWRVGVGSRDSCERGEGRGLGECGPTNTTCGRVFVGAGWSAAERGADPNRAAADA